MPFYLFCFSLTGHGGSDGLHGYVSSLDHVVADTIAFLHWVYEKHPRIPCFLFGHSTGGAVALKVGHSLIFPNVIASYVIQLYLKFSSLESLMVPFLATKVEMRVY